jgi:hypothetical protein
MTEDLTPENLAAPDPEQSLPEDSAGQQYGQLSPDGKRMFYPTRAQGTPTRVYEPMQEKTRKRITLYVTIVAVAFVVIPFLFWRGTWFGRPLNDGDLDQYLRDKSQPRHVQHALVQISERIEKGDESVKRWYPQVAALASSPAPELRVTLAFVLGADPKSELFHKALLELLHDPEVLVQRNAALSLVRFRDDSGIEVIRDMFKPTVVKASANGTVRYRAQLESGVEGGTVVARIEQASGETAEVRTPLPGKVQQIRIPEGSAVHEGDELMVLSPGDLHVWEALRAMVLIGQKQDLELLAQFERFGAGELPANYRTQAELAAAEIRRRSEALGQP